MNFSVKVQFWEHKVDIYRLVKIRSFKVDRKGGINSKSSLTWNCSRSYHSISSFKLNSFRTVCISDCRTIQSLISFVWFSMLPNCAWCKNRWIFNCTILTQWHFPHKIPRNPRFFLILMLSALRTNLRPYEKALSYSTHNWKKSPIKYPVNFNIKIDLSNRFKMIWYSPEVSGRSTARKATRKQRLNCAMSRFKWVTIRVYHDRFTWPFVCNRKLIRNRLSPHYLNLGLYD